MIIYIRRNIKRKQDRRTYIEKFVPKTNFSKLSIYQPTLMKMDIKSGRFRIIVKTNSSQSGIGGFDDSRGAYIVNVKARPEANRANAEVIKILSKPIE